MSLSMKRLLIVHHSASGGATRMRDAVLEGVRLGDAVEVCALPAREAGPADVLGAHGIILGTPENFGYMSGALKDFLERIYHPCLEHTQGLPWALFVRAGNDGRGAVDSVKRIVTGLRWREVAPPVIVRGELDEPALSACRELGETLATGVAAGIF